MKVCNCAGGPVSGVTGMSHTCCSRMTVMLESCWFRKEGRKEIFILASIVYIYKMKYSTILSALETITKTAMRSLS